MVKRHLSSQASHKASRLKSTPHLLDSRVKHENDGMGDIVSFVISTKVGSRGEVPYIEVFPAHPERVEESEGDRNVPTHKTWAGTNTFASTSQTFISHKQPPLRLSYRCRHLSRL